MALELNNKWGWFSGDLVSIIELYKLLFAQNLSKRPSGFAQGIVDLQREFQILHTRQLKLYLDVSNLKVNDFEKLYETPANFKVQKKHIEKEQLNPTFKNPNTTILMEFNSDNWANNTYFLDEKGNKTMSIKDFYYLLKNEGKDIELYDTNILQYSVNTGNRDLELGFIPRELMNKFHPNAKNNQFLFFVEAEKLLSLRFRRPFFVFRLRNNPNILLSAELQNSKNPGMKKRFVLITTTTAVNNWFYVDNSKLQNKIQNVSNDYKNNFARLYEDIDYLKYKSDRNKDWTINEFQDKPIDEFLSSSYSELLRKVA
ncbi:MAG: hypothetical protein PHU51_00045 [Candidatus Nanoarchaeia archaeon]|nr:hypothetical protein [Candidatus Nanoarchaeia archaeon]